MQDFNLIIAMLKHLEDKSIKKGDRFVFIASEKKYLCPDCDSLLVRRLSKFGNNKYWYGCSNYPNCTFTSNENDVDRKAKLIN
jgi:ssDNA-binding Zn-finger/Zn-ribbon topoisomerase 1